MIDGGLRATFRMHLPHVHWVSIETGMTGRGIPDSNGCIDGKEFWIEFKQTKHWQVPMRAEQIGWIMRRVRAGGRVFIAVRRANTELWLFHGAEAQQLLQYGLKARASSAYGIWRGGPAKWDWNAVLHWLTA